MARQKQLFVDSVGRNMNEDDTTSLNENGNIDHNEDGQEAHDDVNDGCKVKKRGRGRSTMNFFTCKNGQPYVLQWNRLGQVIGENEKKFRSACAYYAHYSWLWPLDKKWKEMPQTAFMNTWKLLKRDFILDGHSNAFTFTFEVIHDRHRDWKNKVKQIWLKFGKNPDVMEQKILEDPRIDKTQFTNLIRVWETHEFKAKAMINKTNRDAKFLNHRSGRRPLAMLRDDFEKEKNREATDLDMMQIMYPDTAQTREMESTIHEIRVSQPDVALAEIEIEAYAKVARPLKSDYIRFLGTGHDRSHKHSERERLQAYLQGSTAEHDHVKKLENLIASQSELVQRLLARIEHQEFLLHQQAIWMQQLGHHVGFHYPQSYRQNAHHPSGPSGSTGSGGDSQNESYNIQSSGVRDGDGSFTNASGRAPPFVGGSSTFSHYGYARTYPLPSFSLPTQVPFHHPHESQVDTFSRNLQGANSINDPFENMRPRNRMQPPSHSKSK